MCRAAYHKRQGYIAIHRGPVNNDDTLPVAMCMQPRAGKGMFGGQWLETDIKASTLNLKQMAEQERSAFSRWHLSLTLTVLAAVQLVHGIRNTND